MQVPFLKMHGLGNDFVVLDARQEARALPPETIRWVGDRHRGVGFDQLITLEPASDADVFFRFHNSDGTEAGACGNGTRCVASLVLAETGRQSISIRTPSAWPLAPCAWIWARRAWAGRKCRWRARWTRCMCPWLPMA